MKEMMHKKIILISGCYNIFMKNEYRCILFHQYECVSLIHNTVMQDSQSAGKYLGKYLGLTYLE